MKKKISGVQKTAILLITLGSEVASEIMKFLNEDEINKISFEIATISSVTVEERKEILHEFIEINKAKEFLLEGGFEYAKNILSKALGSDKAIEILDKIKEATDIYRPFTIARKADPTQLLNIIIDEHPQTIALVLCYLQPEKAAQILSWLPDHLQNDVAYRVATIRNTSPYAVKEVERVLEYKLSNFVKPEATVIGGIESLVDMLNRVDRNTERNITSGLENQDKELAEKLRASMFVFEDIATLTSADIQKVLRNIDQKDLALALKGSSDSVKELIFSNLSKGAADNVREEIEYMGPVKLSDVEKAQQHIVANIRKLDEQGEIIIVRGGDDGIIQ